MGLILMNNFAFGQTTYTWTGDDGIAWDNQLNWSPNTGYPTQNDNVVIDDPFIPGNNALITGSEECNNIIFYNDGIIFFATTGTFGTNVLKVYGDLINYSNNAAIVGNNNGNVSMAGGANTEVAGDPIELFHFGIVKNSSSNTVDINTDLSIWLSIKLTMGEINSNSNLRLRADLTNATTASTTPFNADSRINGRVTVEQRVPYSGEYYHYLGSPVSEDSQNTFYTLDAQIVDNASSANVYDWYNQLYNSSFPDYFLYDETECAGLTTAELIDEYDLNLSITLSPSEADWVLTNWGYVSNDNLLTDELPAGTGFISKVDFDQPGDLIDWSGELNDGFIRVQLSKTTCDFGDGLNLVANPYPSPIDWDLLYGINYLEVEAFAYVWTPDAGATNAFGAGVADGYFTVMDASNTTAIIPSPVWTAESGALKDSIAIGQGFLVRALDDNSRLDFENTCRNLFDPVSHILRESKPKDALQLILESPSGKDYTNIYLGNTASDEYNNKEDALKIPNPKVNLATRCDDKKLMINRLSKQKDEIEIPLIISQKAGETSTLSIGNANFESNEYVAIFVDKKLNQQRLITSNFKYKHTSQTGEENDRFVIKFVKGNYSSNNSNATNGNMYFVNNLLHIFSNNMEQASIIISDASGRVVQHEYVNFSNGKAILNLNSLSNGIYIVNVNDSYGGFNQKVFINK